MKQTKPSIVYNPVDRQGNRFVENIDNGLRRAGLAHDLTRLRHTGWYLSEANWAGETVTGAVWQLPARKGVVQYVAGFYAPYMPECATVCFSDITDEPATAALWADGMAERYAEDAREEEAKFQAELRAEEEEEEEEEEDAEQARLEDEDQTK